MYAHIDNFTMNAVLYIAYPFLLCLMMKKTFAVIKVYNIKFYVTLKVIILNPLTCVSLAKNAHLSLALRKYLMHIQYFMVFEHQK